MSSVLSIMRVSQKEFRRINKMHAGSLGSHLAAQDKSGGHTSGVFGHEQKLTLFSPGTFQTPN